MKFLPLTTLLLLLAFSCGQGTQMDTQTLVQEKDSLKSLVNEYNARIAEINKLIAEEDEGFEKNLTLVETLVVMPQRFDHYFKIYGEVETNKNVLLYPESQGILNAISVTEGQQVSKGQLLATIDSEILRNQITELQTNYALAKTTYDKQARLWEQNIGSEMQYLQAKTQKESLESSLATLNSQLAKAQIRAPFAGVVDEIIPNAGEMATPQMPIIRLVNLDEMYIKSDVSEQHLQSVKIGTPVKVSFPSLGKTLEAEISESSKYINPENRSFKVTVDLPKNGDDLRPNQLAHLRINDYSDDNALVLPSSIVMQTAEGADFIYVLADEGDKTFAKRVMVTTGHEYEGQIEILSGIENGTRVISNGAKSVRDGQRVRLS